MTTDCQPAGVVQPSTPSVPRPTNLSAAASTSATWGWGGGPPDPRGVRGGGAGHVKARRCGGVDDHEAGRPALAGWADRT